MSTHSFKQGPGTDLIGGRNLASRGLKEEHPHFPASLSGHFHCLSELSFSVKDGLGKVIFLKAPFLWAEDEDASRFLFLRLREEERRAKPGRRGHPGL